MMFILEKMLTGNLKSLGKIIFFKNLNAEYNNDASDKILEKNKIKEREEFDKIFNLFLNELLPKSYLKIIEILKIKFN